MMTDERQSSEPGVGMGSGTPGSSTGLEPWLVSLLVCPVDHEPVRVKGSELVCGECGRQYPIKNGIPVMIADPPAERT